MTTVDEGLQLLRTWTWGIVPEQKSSTSMPASLPTIPLKLASGLATTRKVLKKAHSTFITCSICWSYSTARRATFNLPFHPDSESAVYTTPGSHTGSYFYFCSHIHFPHLFMTCAPVKKKSESLLQSRIQYPSKYGRCYSTLGVDL